MIEQYDHKSIGPCSINFRLGELFKHKKGKTIELDINKFPDLTKLTLPYNIKPGEYLLGRTIEKMNTPSNIMGIFKIKSQAFRIGLNIISGINDPDYKGNVVFGIHNISQNTIKLYKGMNLLHGVFSELKGEPIPIKSRFMGGKIL